MKLLLLYIFVLFILFSPSILFKSNYIVHSLCFSIILYVTFDLVKFSNRESLKGIIVEDDKKYDSELNVNISNIHESAPSNNVLGKLMLDAFQKVSELKTNITHLNAMLNSYGDSDEELKQIIQLTMETEGKLNLLKQKLVNFNAMTTNSNNLIIDNNLLEVKKLDLTNKLNKCKTDMINNEILISDNNSKILNLNKDKVTLKNNINILDKASYSYKMNIPIIEGKILEKMKNCS